MVKLGEGQSNGKQSMAGCFTALFGLVWLGWQRKVTDRSGAHFNAAINCGGAFQDAA